jgi:hypothetical protein
MPLRDHFHRSNNRRPNWDRLHGGWPMVIAQHLRRILPPGFVAAPQTHVGSFEVDVAAFEKDDLNTGATSDDTGGTAVRVWAPPTLSLDTDPPDVDEYAVRVYDDAEGERLVASVEFVSPRNKDRPDSRRAFVAKCAALLQQEVCVSIVDLVTRHHFNLYADLLDFLGHADPLMGTPAHSIYAVTMRRRGEPSRWRLDTWAHRLQVGQPLPTLPLLLADDLFVPLELEPTYEETCQTLNLTD